MKKLAFLLALVVFAAVAFGVAYTDVSEDHWAYDAVMKATSAGLLQGFPDGTYRGDEAVTRYQLAEAIAKLLDYSESSDAKLQELVFALTKKVASLSLEISDVKKGVIDIMAEFRNLEGKVADIDLDSVEQKVWELREDVYGELNSVKEALDAYDAQFEALNGKTTDLEVTTKLLGQSLAKFKDDFAAYKGRVDAIENKMVTSEQLDQKLSLLYTKILKLSSQLKEIDAIKEEFANYVTVKDYETTVAIVNKLTRDVFKLYRNKADAAALKAYDDKIAALEGTLESTTADIEDSINVVYDQVDANINSIMSLEKKLSEVEGKLSTFAEAGDVEALKGRVTDLEVTSKMLSSSVVKLNDTIANLNFVTPDQLSEKMGFLYKKISMTEDKLSEEISNLDAKAASLNEDVEAVKTDVDNKVDKFQRSTNLATILSFVALAVGTIALILK
ncbi:MAG: S-layer homology domain-containing protein [Kosmotoga sp.]|uniref:S-layer homology domain-containing protein n=1 Tax=Kosmotoga sp. TaxID=1955248 RepID=UPI0025BB6956|nr:S-layer homology domain-containing protein [Kosmotoga sp.]MCD6160594.1 S-layer homology domain-containing protein [Kosmotoga sp.]